MPVIWHGAARGTGRYHDRPGPFACSICVAAPAGGAISRQSDGWPHPLGSKAAVLATRAGLMGVLKAVDPPLPLGANAVVRGRCRRSLFDAGSQAAPAEVASNMSANSQAPARAVLHPQHRRTLPSGSRWLPALIRPAWRPMLFAGCSRLERGTPPLSVKRLLRKLPGRPFGTAALGQELRWRRTGGLPSCSPVAAQSLQLASASEPLASRRDHMAAHQS